MQFRYEGHLQNLFLQCDLTSTRINHFIANSFSKESVDFDFQEMIDSLVISLEFPEEETSEFEQEYEVPELKLDSI